MRRISCRILLRKGREGGYTVMVPTLPGCVAFGGTIEEAIEVYLEDLTERGEEIPTEKDTLEAYA
ncbi:type II toxin-antitoxin system HicB family antitoxin [Methanofollis aquaemaris]|uniref:Type II toxin-antitoxin system HicB family antitoxin n=1 Tax=Methanofollis aquaemaris TaxID=126734 RepID=A0A8A3S695_9EURY|nr:type II toxin-antitoxin system HicB family antitoxin [Methanofollis aquaemaris]QSZ67241.1 type II toxin-antitoxin system HicB family antitoxin [Methanofollis aquaemaris]